MDRAAFSQTTSLNPLFVSKHSHFVRAHSLHIQTSENMAAKIDGVFESSLQAKINNSKLLVVGAGGIGCEILKNLVLSGFSDIEIVSLLWLFVWIIILTNINIYHLILHVWTKSKYYCLSLSD